jgi:hypothetical protein
MKPTDTYWEVNNEGEVICVFHGDQYRRTIAVWKEDFPLSAWKVADLMNEAFKSGVTAKTQQIRRELGL